MGAKALLVTKKINSASFVVQFSSKLDSAPYNRILTAIQEHPSTYSIRRLGKSKAGFRDDQIEDYFGHFETLGCLVRDEVVDREMVYDELGYDIEKAWCNKDIQRIVNDERKADGIISGRTAFYSAFEELARFSLSKDKKTCDDMDKD